MIEEYGLCSFLMQHALFLIVLRNSYHGICYPDTCDIFFFIVFLLAYDLIELMFSTSLELGF